MKKSILLEKYPVYSLEIGKEETSYKTAKEIIAHFEKLVNEHNIAQFIATFDHYAHTTKIGGAINEDILDAQNIVFCFGKAIPNTKMLAARPRSIGVCELNDSFVVDFLEAPNEDMNKLMEDWAKSVANL
ncbi:MAG: hypothetical protein GXO30_00315 [Epsilonproteobacteria bacterium]|nr:hypothetical protein [Campylobacterota bacterium]